MFSVAEQMSETPVTKTVRFEGELRAVPGQFVMVWVPGVDEFPMSVSFSGEKFGVTYQILGEGTKALARMKPGEPIGIRGPYGRGFSIKGKRLLVVGGGLGMAPLGPFVEEAIAHGASVTAVIGAKTAPELLFEQRSRNAGATVNIATEDGKEGFKGLATELVNQISAKEDFDTLYTCGPEKMVAILLQMAKNKGMAAQASLERLMKCGIGICDSCAIDGMHVCRDGPVFSEKELVHLEQLGRTKLDSTGRRIEV